MKFLFEFELPFGTSDIRAAQAEKEILGSNVRDEAEAVVGTVKEAVAVKDGDRIKLLVEADVKDFVGHQTMTIDPPKSIPRAEGVYAPKVLSS